VFDKILIANRGEIACRIIRSARRMGITTVAVYSEADADALHVQMADEAVAIGPAASAESYLVIEKIVQACKDSGAQAVHPGFGFLSENAAFVKALDEAGIVFIGPPTGAIGAMGDKIESKRLAAAANVSTVPGHMELIEDAEEAVRISSGIGYPVMIKASAGGGGKGMRVAGNDDEAREGFRSARSEARTSFGDERIFIEKFVEEPRHIEIQILADKHGNTLYLGERECSIQRRHQKVIEEAPSPFLDEATRQAMGAQSVALARAVDYCSAGTVEFIVDKNRNFYFLEMNTRIQVEHPVTEMITGLDLVEWMIRIAAGEKLGFTQDEVKLDGWAMEARVYAEDPVRNFLPSIGRLVKYSEPEASDSVRVDSGVEEGSEITMFYDPMIAKLVTHGPDRDTALKEMQMALDAFHIRGINHNMGFLAAVMSRPRFREGRLTTNFIAEEFPEGYLGGDPNPQQSRTIAAAAATVQHILAERERELGDQNEIEIEPLTEDWVVCVGAERTPVSVTSGYASYSVAIGREENGGIVYGNDDFMLETNWVPGDALFTGYIEDEAVTLQIDRAGPRLRLTHGGVTVDCLVLRPRVAELNALMPFKAPPDLSRFLLSPMPGLLVSVAVEVGQEVKSGEELAVVEAMKMENLLRAEQDGVVAAIKAAPGESLSVDQVILEFE
jgi:propionyl-CoA carboxylase alpha chain